ncbi:peroxiredoxin [Cupriavidus gilardii J11]|uniref:Peroxiredoxin n=1 Tax=Cupriavidus gilardii J11 TaxID=936133 RepID=A0A562B0U7_9BURK|nr:TlpA disulfide reductase family protein [Cupriavidus gilardii]TWG78746.1 peroxiredoxin [Cupriavidus gilardii J11]
MTATPSPPSSTSSSPAKPRRVWGWIAAAVLATLAGAIAGHFAFSPEPASDQAVEAFFRAELPDPTGTPVRLDTLRGKTVVVNFWAPWCGPCVEEMPDLTALHQEYQARNVEFIGIGIDSAANIQQFTRKVPVSYPLAVAGFAGTEMSRAFGNAAGGLPYTVVIGENGDVTMRKMGRVTPEELRKALPKG